MTAPTFFVSWALVMTAMMLPSELPLLRLEYATSTSASRLAALVAGYLAVWIAVAAPVWLLSTAIHGHTVTAVVLLAAAVYQLTPLKRRCLAVCRAPLARILHGWRDGLTGAARMGLTNGAWCVGCCAGLTITLLAIGMTSVGWMIVLGIAIFVEKATRVGVTASRVSAAALAIGALAWSI